MNDLSPIQKEIAAALQQMKEKSIITEAVLAKKYAKTQRFKEKTRLEFA